MKDKELRKLIGSRAKQRRLELGLKQSYVAEKMGVTASTIQRYEAGTIDNTKKLVLDGLSEALHVSVEWLKGEAEVNLLLNIIHYNAGPLAFITSYVFFEIIVFALEAGLYCRFLKRVSPKKENGDFVLYSFIANSASFWVGYYLATVLPGIF